MTLWFWIHLISFLIYLGLCCFILGKNLYEKLNYIVASLLACFALWSFGNAMMFNSFSTIESSKIFLKITSPGWIFFSAIYLLFIFEFTDKKDFINDWKKIFLIFVPPIIFFIFNIFERFLFCCDKTFFGYTGIWKDIIWVKLFYLYYISYFLFGVYILFDYVLKEKNLTKKRTAAILLSTMLFCFIGGTITSVILKETKKYVPIEANVILLIFASGIIYAMYKYQFLSITPYRATELILNTINEGYILLNNEAKIKNFNKVVLNIFECGENIKICENLIYDSLKDKINILKYKPILNEEMEILTQNGNYKNILFSGAVLKEKNENIGYIILLTDISELKFAKKELKDNIEKLVESNKELEKFAYIVSHDLKEPLRMITSYVELLQKRYKNKLDKDADDFINYAVSGVARMNQLINNLLEYSRVIKKEPQIENIDIKEIIDEVLNIFKFKLELKAADIKISSDLPVIKVDRIDILRVFQNLIDNALKFNENISVKIEINAIEKNNNYIFSIKDNGIGVLPENKEKIFAMFQKVNLSDKAEGNGIGLAICKKIIEKYNGKIWVESEGIGKGCVFYFSLPKYKDK